MNVKKFLAVALSVLLIVSVMPFAAFAAGNTLDVATGADLKTQIAAADAGDTIRFTADITFTAAQVGLKLDKNLTFDLNGCTLFATANGSVNSTHGSGYDPKNRTEVFFTANDANITFEDSVGGGSFAFTYNANSGAYFVDARGNSVITVNSGSYTADRANFGGYIFYVRDNAKLVINDGTFETISKANVNKRDAAVYSNTGTTTVEVNGGAFTTDDSFDNPINNSGTTKITDGDFNGTMNLTAGKTTITGGTFLTYDGEPNGAVAAYLPADQVIDANGEVAQVAASTVAKINSQEFETLEAAIAAATNDANIILLQDVSVANTIVIDNGVKFNIAMNGNAISSTKRVFEIRHGGIKINGAGEINTTAISAVAVYGSTDSTASSYSTFTLNSATINAPQGYGAMIGANGTASFGASVNIDGTVNSKYGVYVNGNIAQTDSKNAAKFYIYGTVNATAENAAVYAAGYANWTIGIKSTPANITGGTGIYIKSGNMTIKNANITATGAATAYSFNTNGCDGTGDAIIIDSCGYPGSVPTVTINAGTITSANGAAVASYTKQDDARFADAEFPRVEDVIPATSTAVFSSDVSDLAVDGYAATYDAVKGGYVIAEDTFVAEVAGVKYDTLQDALAAISTVTTAKHNRAVDTDYDYTTYVANGTIKLLADIQSTGIIIGEGSDLTIDFNGHTLDINSKPVGSNGTETIGMQLLKDSTIVFKNGTLTSSYTYAAGDTEYILRLIQNYADLTLDNMNVGMKGNFYNTIAISTCNGDFVVKDSTISAPDFSAYGYSVEEAADMLGAEALTLGTFQGYTEATAEIKGDSTVNGNVSVDVGNPADATNTLTLTSGTLNGDIVMKDNANEDSVEITKADTFTQEAPEEYKWVDNGDGTSSLVRLPEVAVAGISLSVADSIDANFYIAQDAVVAYDITGITVEDAAGNAVAVADLGVVGDLHMYQIKTVAKQMNDKFTVTPITSAEVIKVAKDYSIVDYVKAVLADENATGAMKTMLVDMLAYGSAAQSYLGYNTSALAIDELSAAEKSYGTSDFSEIADGVHEAYRASKGNAVATKLSGAQVQYDDNANLVLVVYAPHDDEASLKVYKAAPGGAREEVEFTAVYTGPSQFKLIIPQEILEIKDMAEYTVVASDGETMTLGYSVGTYCAWAMNSSSNAQAISQALLAFGNSALAAL